MDPEDKDYVCTLDEFSLEKAKRELFEDPKQRLGAVQTLRAWIRSQPHFTSRADTKFLLAVLRTAKFSQLRAREIIETILTMRTKCPEYMVNIDTHEPGLLAFIDNGIMIPIPKLNKEHQAVVILRLAVPNLKDPLMTIANEMRASLACQELFKENDENGIVNGVHLIFDCTGVTLKYLTRATQEENKNTTKIYQDCNTGRVKGFHFYNAGAIFEMMMTISKPLMKKKTMDRLHVYDTLESLYKVIPMELWPTEYLPDDYTGPSVGSVDDILADLKRRLMEPKFRTRLLDFTHERYKIDMKKKDSTVPQESFRKLNID